LVADGRTGWMAACLATITGCGITAGVGVDVGATAGVGTTVGVGATAGVGATCPSTTKSFWAVLSKRIGIS